MTALALRDEVPDLLGTSPDDLIASDVDRPQATEEEARARLAEIRAGIPTLVHTHRKIADAYACRDWLALGYESWEHYRDANFGELLDRTLRDERRQAVAELRKQGMSIPQIAAIVRASSSTVHSDIESFSATENLPAAVRGSDGKTHPAKREKRERTEATPEGVKGEAATSSASGPVAQRAAGPDAPTHWRCFGCEHQFEAASNTCPKCGGWGIRQTAEGTPACDQCGGPVEPDEAAAGYLRCADCDPDGEHVEGRRPVETVNLPAQDVPSEPPRDPAERIAAVAEAAPEFVRPAPSPVEQAVAEHLPADPDDVHRSWRRNFMAAISAAYKPTQFTAEDVAQRADDECVAELARVGAELTRFAERVRELRAASLPDNVVPMRGQS